LNSIPELQEFADKILQWKKLHISNDSKEYNLFCYRIAQMLHEHEYRKIIFISNPHSYDHQDSHIPDLNESKEKVKVEGVLLKDLFSTFLEESE